MHPAPLRRVKQHPASAPAASAPLGHPEHRTAAGSHLPLGDNACRLEGREGEDGAREVRLERRGETVSGVSGGGDTMTRLSTQQYRSSALPYTLCCATSPPTPVYLSGVPLPPPEGPAAPRIVVYSTLHMCTEPEEEAEATEASSST